MTDEPVRDLFGGETPMEPVRGEKDLLAWAAQVEREALASEPCEFCGIAPDEAPGQVCRCVEGNR